MCAICSCMLASTRSISSGCTMPVNVLPVSFSNSANDPQPKMRSSALLTNRIFLVSSLYIKNPPGISSTNSLSSAARSAQCKTPASPETESLPDVSLPRRVSKNETNCRISPRSSSFLSIQSPYVYILSQCACVCQPAIRILSAYAFSIITAFFGHTLLIPTFRKYSKKDTQKCKTPTSH